MYENDELPVPVSETGMSTVGLEALQDNGGPPSDTFMQVFWVFRLNKRDALLVMKALGGRLVSDQEQADAAALGDRLTLLRAQCAKEALHGYAKAEEAVRAKESRG